MYIDVKDIINLLSEQIASQLTDDQSGSFINEDLLSEINDNQSSLIDNYLRGRYTLPLSNSHYILQHINFALVKYELYKRRNIVTDSIQDEYNRAMSMLNDIKQGIVLLNETASNSFAANLLDTVFTNEL